MRAVLDPTVPDRSASSSSRMDRVRTRSEKRRFFVPDDRPPVMFDASCKHVMTTHVGITRDYERMREAQIFLEELGQEISAMDAHERAVVELTNLRGRITCDGDGRVGS